MVLVTCGFWVFAPKPAANLAQRAVRVLQLSLFSSCCFIPCSEQVTRLLVQYSQDLLLAGRTNNTRVMETFIIPLALAARGASLAAAGARVLWLIWAGSRRVGWVMCISCGCVRGDEF